MSLKSVFCCSRLAVKGIAPRGSGVIVTITSVGAYAAQRQAAGCSATNAGIPGFTGATVVDGGWLAY